jgi:signal peptidase I
VSEARQDWEWQRDEPAAPAAPAAPMPEPTLVPRPVPLVVDPPPPAVPLPSDDELRALLAERDRKDEEEARAASRELGPGPCPVCDGALEARRMRSAHIVARCGSILLRPFVRRHALACKGCGLEVEAAPTSFGWLLTLVLALGAAIGGAATVIRAQQLTDPNARTLMIVGGVGALAAGLFVGWQTQGMGSSSAVAGRIVRGRRRRRGEPAMEELPAQGWVSENLEAVVVAVILALIIRHFVMEAFVIPTGSMAPTLLGDHFDVTCPSCAYGFSVGKNEDELQGPGERISITARCPLCDQEFDSEQTPREVMGGNKILVNKFAYELAPPRRWDVVVFKYPKEPWKNYIKRLVGLPGDTLEVENGDLRVNGALARKPDHVQDAIWIPVYDGAYVPKERDPPWWVLRPDAASSFPSSDATTAPWSLGDGSRIACSPAADEASWIEFNRAIKDQYGYSRSYDEGDSIVSDLRVTASVTPATGAVVRLAIVEVPEDGGEPRVVAARFPVGGGTFAIEVNGQVEREAEATPLAPGATVDIALAYADDRARILVDGRAVLAWDDPFAPPGAMQSSSVRLGCAHAPVTFERPRIDRDVHYVRASYGHHDPASGPVVVPEGSYFVMGDNSPNSEDGRKWGFVSEGHLIGRAFMVFWPVVPLQVKRIR